MAATSLLGMGLRTVPMGIARQEGISSNWGPRGHCNQRAQQPNNCSGGEHCLPLRARWRLGKLGA